MNTKLGLTIFSTLKVIGHLLVAAAVTGLIITFSHRTELVLYMPVVNIFTSALIKYFSITPAELPTIDSLPPQA
jgi:hypothetical protein